jgi:hypothetical protein
MAKAIVQVRRVAGRVRRRLRVRRGDRAPHFDRQLRALQNRVTELEAEVQECRNLNLRLAELTDLVQELLVPIAQREGVRAAEEAVRYTREI